MKSLLRYLKDISPHQYVICRRYTRFQDTGSFSYSLGKCKSFCLSDCKGNTWELLISGCQSFPEEYKSSILFNGISFVPQGQGVGLIHWCPTRYIYIVALQQTSVDENLMMIPCFHEYIIHVAPCWLFYIWLGFKILWTSGGLHSKRRSLYSHSKIHYTSRIHTLSVC